MGDATVVETAEGDDLIQQVATLQQQLAEMAFPFTGKKQAFNGWDWN
jgi:hypothetical protein